MENKTNLDALMAYMADTMYDALENGVPEEYYDDDRNERTRRYRRKQRNLHIKKKASLHEAIYPEDVNVEAGRYDKGKSFVSSTIPKYQGYSVKDIRRSDDMLDDIADYLSDYLENSDEDCPFHCDLSDVRQIQKNHQCYGRDPHARLYGLQAPTRDKVDVAELMQQRAFLKEFEDFFR